LIKKKKRIEFQKNRKSAQNLAQINDRPLKKINFESENEMRIFA